MAKLSKRTQKIVGLVDRAKTYDVKAALDLVKKTATAKFDESVDVAVNLGIDAKKSDQVVRGSVVLPRGTGKKVRVAVFAQGANAEKAKNAGADVVGFDDLAEKIKGGFMDFDVVIATPDAMKVVGPLGQVLGPRGLMRTAHDGVELSEPEIDTLRRLNLKPALGAEATLEAQVPQRLIDYGYVVRRDSGRLDITAKGKARLLDIGQT